MPEELILEQTAGHLKGQRWHVPADGAVLGRSVQADVTIEEDLLSRRHCRIWAEGGRWHVEDLDSRHGVSVNGESCHRASLSVGDRLKLADYKFRVVQIALTGAVTGEESGARPTEKPLDAGERIPFRCACGKVYAVRAEKAGHKVRCGACGKGLIVPDKPPAAVASVEPEAVSEQQPEPEPRPKTEPEPKPRPQRRKLPLAVLVLLALTAGLAGAYAGYRLVDRLTDDDLAPDTTPPRSAVSPTPKPATAPPAPEPEQPAELPGERVGPGAKVMPGAPPRPRPPVRTVEGPKEERPPRTDLGRPASRPGGRDRRQRPRPARPPGPPEPAPPTDPTRLVGHWHLTGERRRRVPVRDQTVSLIPAASVKQEAEKLRQKLEKYHELAKPVREHAADKPPEKVPEGMSNEWHRQRQERIAKWEARDKELREKAASARREVLEAEKQLAMALDVGRMKNATSDTDGHFSFRNVDAGKYYLFARATVGGIRHWWLEPVTMPTGVIALNERNAAVGYRPHKD